MENANSGKTAWDRIREVAGLKHLSLRTEQAYVQWVRRFWIFVRKRNLRSVGVEEIRHSSWSHLCDNFVCCFANWSDKICREWASARRRF